MTPDCPSCDARQTLEPVTLADDDQPGRWFVCTCCARPVLVRVADGVILRVGKP